jgi:hypothetical protein
MAFLTGTPDGGLWDLSQRNGFIAWREPAVAELHHFFVVLA